MVTEYMMSSRWSAHSPMKERLDAVVRVVTCFQSLKHQDIRFTEKAPPHLLRCQLQQSLLGDDCDKIGETTGEALQDQASGELCIHSVVLAILRLGCHTSRLRASSRCSGQEVPAKALPHKQKQSHTA